MPKDNNVIILFKIFTYLNAMVYEYSYHTKLWYISKYHDVITIHFKGNVNTINKIKMQKIKETECFAIYIGLQKIPLNSDVFFKYII